MKIPETSANVGAYYGNEENGQWQPNGVIIDSGVGGGVVGSGDAGLHRPVYPLHIPRGHVSGYVMAGAYYGPAGVGVGVGAGAGGAAGYAPGPPPDDFADYMWMEHEEEFDKQVMQQLEEEALMEQCIEAMLEDEQRERQRPNPGHNHPTTSNGTSLSLEETVSRSTLNPLAAEFVPTRRTPPSTEEKTEPPAEPTTEAEHKPTEEVKQETDTPITQPVDDSKTEAPQTEEPPEVSAAEVQPERVVRKDSKRLDTKRQDSKKDSKPAKQDTKKTKPLPAKSETKIQQSKKKEVKAVKSECKVNDAAADHTATTPVPQTAPAPQAASAPALAPQAAPAPAPAPAPAITNDVPSTTHIEVSKPAPPTPVEEIPSGPKPINYAAAAKANKPKKPTVTPLTTEKTPPPTEKKPTEKPKTTAANKPVQRKNSAK